MAERPDSQLVHIEVLADFVGVTTRRLRQLETDGVIKSVPNEKGRGRSFDFLPTVKKLMGYYRERAEKKQAGKNADAIEAEKLKKLAAESEIKQLELAVKKGELHAGEDIERVFGNMVGRLRVSLLSLPQSVAPLLVDKSDANEIAETIDGRIVSAMQELSEYDVTEFVGGSVSASDATSDE